MGILSSKTLEIIIIIIIIIVVDVVIISTINLETFTNSSAVQTIIYIIYI
jgi:hypothetical protein